MKYHSRILSVILMTLLGVESMHAEDIVDVTTYGAKGDGKTDDTAAIQKAIDAAPLGATIRFAPGTYMVSSVGLRHGRRYLGDRATIKRLPKQDKWTRTFTTEKEGYLYSGNKDSAPLVIEGLRFDGNRSEQGAYTDYELEHAHLLFLQGDPAKKGRLKAIVRNCHFRECVADGVSVWANVDTEISGCSSYNCFRGGFTLTGGNSRVLLTDFTSDGNAHSRGIDIEVDGTGYGKSLQVDVTMKKVRLKDGYFDIAVSDGSTVTGEDIVSHGNFCLYAEKSKVRIKDSSFGVGRFSNTDERFIRPGDTEFRNCTFTARPGMHDIKNGPNQWAVVHVYWNVGDSKLTGQQLRFENCKFTTADINQSDKAYVFYVEPEDSARNNTLVIRNCTFAPRFNVPFEILGGQLRVETGK